MAEEAEAQAGEQGAEVAPKKSKKMLFLVLGLVLVLLLAGGGAAAFFLLKKKDGKMEEASQDAAAEEETAKLEGTDEEPALEEGEEALGAIIPFDTFLVNLNGGKYVRVQIQIEFETLDVPSRYYSRIVPIRDGVVSLLAQQTADDLMVPKGKESLKVKIRTMINDLLRREEVKRVYFTQFVIQ